MLKKKIFSPFPKQQRAIAGSSLPCKGKDSQEKLTGPRFPLLGEERSCRGAISVVFNTKENLRDLGKQKCFLTKFRIKEGDVSLNFLLNGWLPQSFARST